MAKEFRKIRRILIPFLSLVLLTGLATEIAAQTVQPYTADLTGKA